MVDDYLLQVRKPARYTGGEWNASGKDFDKADVKFALCFPDLYEIGMSNIGIRIIYGLLNAVDGIVCERIFSPDADMEAHLRRTGMGLLSLESRRKMKDFDIVGISMGHELCYTNILNILDLGGIGLEASARNHDFPLVIGGGPGALNPEPMHEFFDLFILGEAEEVVREVIDMYLENKEAFRSARMAKRQLLLKFSAIEGVYVPSLYDVTYHETGRIEGFRPKDGAPDKIKKRFVKDLKQSFYPREWIVPYIQIVHDRIALEIMRGCPNRCRFCQARSQYFPFRLKERAQITEMAVDIYKRTGYEEISLCGLSVSDHPQIEDIARDLTCLLGAKAVSLSLPSVKPRAYTGQLSSIISTVKKTGLTFAPEASSARLRSILGKDFNEEEFFATLEKAYASGYRRVKLYFMIGLPHEQDSDLDGLLDFARRVSESSRRVNKQSSFVNISINTLIPKPHTPLQWLEAVPSGEIKRKQDYLRRKNKNNKIKMDFHDCSVSQLEAVFSRGDRRLSSVVKGAFMQGARFDAWTNIFRPDYWQRAFEVSGIDPRFYLRRISRDEILPWGMLDTGISNETLLAEYEKVVAIE